MEKRKLEMDFIDGMNKRFRLSLDNPNEDLDTIQVEAAMDQILANNIFISNGTDLVDLEGARVVTTVVEEMEFFL